jgi:signal transduction histidine kinase
MAGPVRIVLIDSNGERRRATAAALRAEGCEVAEAQTVDEGRQAAEAGANFLIADMNLSGLDSSTLAALAKRLASVPTADAARLAKIAHDLRTPLNAIMGWAQLLKYGDLDEQATREAYDIIERSGQAQAELISSLLGFKNDASGNSS